MIYHSASVKRLVRVLAANGITTRQGLMTRFDVDTRSYEAVKGIGPILSDLLVWLRGLSIDQFTEITGLPGFDM